MKANICILLLAITYFKASTGRNINTYIVQLLKAQNDIDVIIQQAGADAIAAFGIIYQQADPYTKAVTDSVTVLTNTALEGVCLNQPANLTLVYSKSRPAYLNCLSAKTDALKTVVNNINAAAKKNSDYVKGTYLLKLSQFDGTTLDQQYFADLLVIATSVILNVANIFDSVKEGVVYIANGFNNCISNNIASNANEADALVQQLSSKCPVVTTYY